MIILGIETSCDETACAILKKENNRITIFSNAVASSASLQAKYGGIIPEQAAREQIKAIIPVIEEALEKAFPNYNLQPTTYKLPIDAIAVTYGPGLIGSLLVGVETAKTLAMVWDKPLIPVNHLIGHFYANWINQSTDYSLPSTAKKPSVVGSRKTEDIPSFPCLGLLVSGGHTDLVLFTDHGKYKYLGGTRDDAAGECFDKCARLLGLPYPGGPHISKLAQKGDPYKFKLPIPMKGSKDLDFSYSGLKTAVANLIKDCHVVPQSGTPRNDTSTTLSAGVIASEAKQSQTLANLAASIENAIVQSLLDKVILALKAYPVKNVMIAGGVAANTKLVSELKKSITHHLPTTTLHVPPPELCTDNGAMIAAAGFFTKETTDPLKLQADPNLSL